MIATEFMKDGKPDGAAAKAIIGAARDENLLLLGCGTFGNIIRWIPPLVVTDDEIKIGLERFETALKKILG
jgi:4-aminobutyrate aminotransferase